MPWLMAVVFLVAYEVWALATGRRTLSRMIYDANTAWPLLSTLVGLVVGGLLVHFFWHYCPAGSVSAG